MGSSKSKGNHTKSKKKKNPSASQNKSNIHVGYRIGALVLVIVTAVSLIAMYAFL